MVHDWYRFILAYPPHLVRTYLERFAVMPDHTVLDPFSGTGTTIVECKKRSISGIGSDANPIAVLASRTKSDWIANPDSLRLRASRIAERAGETDQSILRTLTPDAEALVSRGAISPLPLHKTLNLLDAIREEPNTPPHLLLALAKALVSSISNLWFAPGVTVGPAKADAPVIESWLNNVNTIAADLELMQPNTVTTTVHHADARTLCDVLTPGSIDAVITSPPYPNESDYSRATRLESVLLGYLNNRLDAQTLKQTLLCSSSRNVYQGDTDDAWVAGNDRVQRIASEIEQKRQDLGKTDGFSRLYARAVKLYFGGMRRHLRSLKPALKDGASLAYVVGDQASFLQVHIHTGEILAEIAESEGYTIAGVDLFRTRQATKTGKQMREEVVLLRWTP
ncbi:DNA methyltransferase [Leptolyngbya sp. FACHB-402]|nr:DNA methyltransferase [Leptolyngbya sp. FACHB-238]MBD2397404.1 DNA methyltransferase [Leptolyngbya sp. FACHB-239]MBD2403791.1 DNA methyltransferase [Leptolyngbya sp. FACHB-402]